MKSLFLEFYKRIREIGYPLERNRTDVIRTNRRYTIDKGRARSNRCCKTTNEGKSLYGESRL